MDNRNKSYFANNTVFKMQLSHTTKINAHSE